MVREEQFELALEQLKETHPHGSFAYDNPAHSFREVVSAHFRSVLYLEQHGFYLVRQRETGEVLYIGKGGTVDADGRLKNQDVRGRLRNTKGRLGANDWARSLVEEKGAFVVEYIFLTMVPRSPAFVEATLLQEYLNANGRLPYRNKAL